MASAKHPAPTATPILSATSRPVTLTFPNPTGKAEHEGLIACITFDAPERLNAVRGEDIRRFVDALQWIAAQPKILFTVITGRGRFFSAGADVKDPARGPPEAELAQHAEGSAERALAVKTFTNSRFAVQNLSFAQVLHAHPKILVGAMNGPAVGIMATLLGHCDLVYSYKEFWLSVPFMSLALVSEGGACLAFAKKMGLGRAQVALLEGKRMEAEDLRQSGFISHIFPTPDGAVEKTKQDKAYTPPILDAVLAHLGDRYLPPTADPFSLLFTKELLRTANYDGWDMYRAALEEIKGAEQVFMSGRPQAQFARVAGGGRHKL